MSTVIAGNETAVGAVQLYVDGVAKGDAAALEQAFNEGAWMYGAMAGDRLDMPITEMIKMIAAKPADVDGTFNAVVRSVEEEGDAAVVTLEEQGFWGALSFVDYFSLVRIDGSWKIVNKTFAHTGGSLPGVKWWRRRICGAASPQERTSVRRRRVFDGLYTQEG